MKLAKRAPSTGLKAQLKPTRDRNGPQPSTSHSEVSFVEDHLAGYNRQKMRQNCNFRSVSLCMVAVG